MSSDGVSKYIDFRGCVGQAGSWWKPEQCSLLEFQFTKEGEDQLFGNSRDHSQLQLQDALRFATHVQFRRHKSDGRNDSALDCRFQFASILKTADNPLPSLQSLRFEEFISSGVASDPVSASIYDAINSRKLSNLTSLTIWHRGFDFQALAISKEIGCLPFLKVLHLDGLGGEIERGHNLALAEVIQTGHMPLLEELMVRAHQMTATECQAYAAAFSSGQTPLLTSIDLLGNSIGDEGVQALGSAFISGHLPSLTSINLRRNNIGSEGVQALGSAFISGQLPSLTSVELSGNSIRDEGVQALVSAIRSGQLKKLVGLYLCRCGFHDDGMIALVDSFRAAPGNCVPKLKTLDITWNDFSDVGLCALADVLKAGHLKSLEKLELRLCYKVSSKGAGALISALASNIHLNVEVQYEWEKFPDLERRMEQLTRGRQRYRDILAGLADSPRVPATIGKIYLCGNQEVGKTTLRHSLLRSFWKSVLTWETRPHAEPRTRGIDVSQMVGAIKKPGESPTTLLVWDMAGQRDYHIMHNAFLPDLGSVEGKATTFVVVCGSKNTIEESERQLDYWLRFIASSCVEATGNLRHVLVVLNVFRGEKNAFTLAPAWKQMLECLKQKFQEYLNVWTHPFIADVRKRESVKDMKLRLLQHSRALLRDEMVPEICQTLQQNLRAWSEARRQFPVLEWTAFVRGVRETSSEPWSEKDLQAATRYLNEAGVLIFIEKEVFGRRKLVVLDPNWFCKDIVGNMFLHPEMVAHGQPLFRMKVDRKTGSISITDFKVFFMSLSSEWTNSSMEDLITIMLWLGLCYQGVEKNIFIPSLIAESGTPDHAWGHGETRGNSSEYGEDQWVMGFSVEHHQSNVTLAPIALWHRFQVELAQGTRFNGRADNDFDCGKYCMRFSVDHMAVLIEVTNHQDNPTFDNINIYVKPLWGDADDDLDGNDRKQCQVDLASELVEIGLSLWNEVCPGVEYLHKVVWPWPASLGGVQIRPERNVDVEVVKKWVLEHNPGRKMQWKVGCGTITEDQLLSSKDKASVGKSLERSRDVLTQVLVEAMDLGVYPTDVLSDGVSCEESSVIMSESLAVVSPSRSRSEQRIEKKLEYISEQVNEVHRKVDRIHKLNEDILKNQKWLRQMVQDVGDIFLHDKERSCPRFIYLGEKSSGRWVSLKESMSPSVSFQLHFLCEARYDAYGQHAVKDQQGLEVSHLKKWAETIAPWLTVSLTALYISAKIGANVVLPGAGLMVPDFASWAKASSLSEGLALATGFTKEALKKHLAEGMGLDISDPNRDPRELYGKSRAAMTELIGKLTPEAYEEKLGL